MFVALGKARQERQWMTWTRAEHPGIGGALSLPTHTLVLFKCTEVWRQQHNTTRCIDHVLSFSSDMHARSTSIRFGMFSLPNLLFQISKIVRYQTFFVHSFMGASPCTSWNSACLSLFWRSFRWRHRLSPFSLCSPHSHLLLMAKLKRTESTFAFHLPFPPRMGNFPHSWSWPAGPPARRSTCCYSCSLTLQESQCTFCWITFAAIIDREREAVELSALWTIFLQDLQSRK